MLTYNEVTQIYMDLMAGRPVSVPGKEAKECAERMQPQMDEIVAKGGFFQIPNE